LIFYELQRLIPTIHLQYSISKYLKEKERRRKRKRKTLK